MFVCVSPCGIFNIFLHCIMFQFTGILLLSLSSGRLEHGDRPIPIPALQELVVKRERQAYCSLELHVTNYRDGLSSRLHRGSKEITSLMNSSQSKVFT